MRARLGRFVQRLRYFWGDPEWPIDVGTVIGAWRYSEQTAEKERELARRRFDRQRAHKAALDGDTARWTEDRSR